MMINDITRAAGRHKRRKRVGRGESSGRGKTSGRGHKGCQARAGGGVRPLTEGGQMPVFRRLPKRGFSNFKFRTNYEIVNVEQLERRFADGDTVDLDALRKLRLIQGRAARVKILAKGTLGKRLVVEAHACSAKARQVIEAAGGSFRALPLADPAAAARAKRNTAKGRTAERRTAQQEAARAAGDAALR